MMSSEQRMMSSEQTYNKHEQDTRYSIHNLSSCDVAMLYVMLVTYVLLVTEAWSKSCCGSQVGAANNCFDGKVETVKKLLWQ